LKGSSDRSQAICALPGIGYLGPPRLPPPLVFRCRLAYIYMCVCTYSYTRYEYICVCVCVGGGVCGCVRVHVSVCVHMYQWLACQAHVSLICGNRGIFPGNIGLDPGYKRGLLSGYIGLLSRYRGLVLQIYGLFCGYSSFIDIQGSFADA